MKTTIPIMPTDSVLLENTNSDLPSYKKLKCFVRCFIIPISLDRTGESGLAGERRNKPDPGGAQQPDV